MGDFHQLVVWQKAHNLTLDVYRATANFPKHEMFGLTSQVRRASVSIPANIAEGTGRGGDREFLRFLTIAMGSAAELEYHVLLAHELNYVSDHDYETIIKSTSEVLRMLRRLHARIVVIDRDARRSDSRLATRDS
jgi:four helix bundle protein